MSQPVYVARTRGDAIRSRAAWNDDLVPVVDLFAGPGGLGEGFASARDGLGNPCFEITLSIEKDEYAHRTLALRAFFREFGGQAPDEYYRYLQGEITRDELFGSYPVQAKAALCKAWHAELGSELFPPENIDRRIRDSLKGAERWVLIGGPPCQAYSVIGRARMRSADPTRFEQDPRHFLYREYLRILAIHRPSVFIMENVQGILSTRINGDRVFMSILSDLQEPHKCFPDAMLGRKRFGPKFRYRLHSLVKHPTNRSPDPSSFLVKMKHYGIPQDRNRVIILGIREDIDIRPDTLRKSDEIVPLWRVVGDLPKLRSRLSKETDSWETWSEILSGTAESPWTDCVGIETAVQARMISTWQQVCSPLATGGRYVHCDVRPEYVPEWFSDSLLRGVCNHCSRSHMRTDIQRYLFASCFALVHRRTPLLRDFPEALLPEHKNARRAVRSRHRFFSDRFRVQVAAAPATTVTSHMAKDGHYFIHPDPCQCRSLTVREAARIQTFPDNYFFEGPQTSQYQQVGNAVPPLLAKSIAGVIYAGLRRSVTPARQLELTLLQAFQAKQRA